MPVVILYPFYVLLISHECLQLQLLFYLPFPFQYQTQAFLLLIPYKKSVIQLMDAPFQTHTRGSPSGFTKGMTLSEYMARLDLEASSDPQQLPEQQQNLYQETQLNARRQAAVDRQRFSIKEEDEESAEESMEGMQDEVGKKYDQEQRTKETFRQSNFFLEHTPARMQHPMNATAYFNHSNEKHSFRVKHLSNSPFKKKTDSEAQPAPMTLYGRKFVNSIGKTTRSPELATFYGRIKEKTEERVREMPTPAGVGAGKVKGNFKKKSGLQLQQLLKFEQKIKSNYSQKIYFQDIRIEGIKDKICERKNKLY